MITRDIPAPLASPAPQTAQSLGASLIAREDGPRAQAGLRLQLLLWSAWTLVVFAIAYLSWHADMLAQRPLNLIGLSIHCAVGGMIGLIVLTLIEMRVEPWRFVK